MRVFAHPFRVAGSAVATVEQGTDAEARQVIQAVLSIPRGTRTLGPEWGIDDPAGAGVSAAEVRAAVELCEPDLTVTAVSVEATSLGRQRVLVAAAWTSEA